MDMRNIGLRKMNELQVLRTTKKICLMNDGRFQLENESTTSYQCEIGINST